MSGLQRREKQGHFESPPEITKRLSGLEKLQLLLPLTFSGGRHGEYHRMYAEQKDQVQLKYYLETSIPFKCGKGPRSVKEFKFCTQEGSDPIPGIPGKDVCLRPWRAVSSCHGKYCFSTSGMITTDGT